MKVTFCAYDRPGYVGGPNAGLRRLLPDLKKRGIEAEGLFLIFGDPAECRTIQALEKSGVRCSFTHYQDCTEKRVRWLLKQLKENPPDVFVPNLMPAAYFAARWAREAGIATVGVLRSVDRFHMDIIDEFVEGRPEFRLSAMVCVSEFLKQEVESRNIPLDAVVRIPSSAPVPEHKVRFDEKTLKIVYVGRFVEEAKRVTDLAKALCRALREVPGAEAVLYGDGIARTSVEKVLASQGNGLPVRLGGMVQPEAVQERMLENHVVVLLSDYEGMPLCLLEGMACGLVPVCLRTESGVPEIVEHGETGIIVENRGDDFVAAIRALRADASGFEKLSAGAREKIKQEYSSEICAQKWQDLIESLAAPGRAKRDVAVPLMLDLPPVRSGLSREDQRTAPLKLAAETVKGCFKTIGTGLGAAGRSLCKGLF